MADLKKIFLMPYFGNLPEWYDKYRIPEGYYMLIDTNLEAFKKRVKDKLGIDCPIVSGTGKAWDYRAVLGVLYEEEIEGYDFYGHTDFDCVYGDVSKWVTNEFLSELDVHSNHDSYIMGAWTLYRNTKEVRELYKSVAEWKQYLIHPEPNGWVEEPFSRALEQSGLRYKYTFWQGNPYTTTPELKKEGSNLYQLINEEWEEIMQFHFRRSKHWPL